MFAKVDWAAELPCREVRWYSVGSRMELKPAILIIVLALAATACSMVVGSGDVVEIHIESVTGNNLGLELSGASELDETLSSSR